MNEIVKESGKLIVLILIMPFILLGWALGFIAGNLAQAFVSGWEKGRGPY